MVWRPLSDSIRPNEHRVFSQQLTTIKDNYLLLVFELEEDGGSDEGTEVTITFGWFGGIERLGLGELGIKPFDPKGSFGCVGKELARSHLAGLLEQVLMGFLVRGHRREVVVTGMVDAIDLLRSLHDDSSRRRAEGFDAIDVFLTFVEFAPDNFYRVVKLCFSHIVTVVVWYCNNL